MFNFKHNLVILDCEMTGLDPQTHQITEICALKCDPRNFKILERFHSYVGPYPWKSVEEIKRSADPWALKKGRVDLNSSSFTLAPKPLDVLERFSNWLPSEYILVGFNLYLDISFIRNLAESSQAISNPSRYLSYRVIDLIGLMELFYANNSELSFVEKSLSSFARQLGIEPTQAHSASGDCETTHKVLVKLLSNIKISESI